MVDGADETFERAARNLPKVDVIRAAGVNVYDVLGHQKLLLTRGGLDAMTARLGVGTQ